MPKKQLSGVEVRALVCRLKSLKGSFLQKVYQPSREEVVLRLNVPIHIAEANGGLADPAAPPVADGGGACRPRDADGRTHGAPGALPGDGDARYIRRDLVLLPGRCIAVREPREMPARSAPFAQACRKHLDNLRLASVEQLGIDRIVVFEFGRIDPFRLVVELLRPGNVVLVRGGRVVNSLFRQRWRHRVVRPGEQWSPPPSLFDPTAMGEAAFGEALRGSDGEVVRILATRFGLGGPYAEEACRLASVEKERGAAELGNQEAARLLRAIRTIIAEAERATTGFVWSNGGVDVDVTPIRLGALEARGWVGREVPDLFAAMNEAFSAAEEGEETDPERSRLQRLMDRQTEAAERFGEEEAHHRRCADLLFEHYARVDEWIRALRDATERLGWEEVARRVKGRGDVVSINPAAKSVVLRLGDEEIPIRIDLDVNGNAGLLYEAAKRAHQKREGAIKALEECRGSLSSHGPRVPKAEGGLERRRVFWFERHRWLFTSAGNLVVAGRDRAGNERVVKRYLRPGDRYCHAEVHGAPSCVLKSEGEEVPEESLREGCWFALIHSKAWHTKVGEGTAYWVTPEQVSKTPNAGEFVPKGAFIVRGKRHYYTGLPMVAAVGKVMYRGEPLVMCGPEPSVSAHADAYAVIAPGEDSTVPQTIARELGVGIEEVQRALPPGSSSIERWVTRGSRGSKEDGEEERVEDVSDEDPAA